MNFSYVVIVRLYFLDKIQYQGYELYLFFGPFKRPLIIYYELFFYFCKGSLALWLCSLWAVGLSGVLMRCLY